MRALVTIRGISIALAGVVFMAACDLSPTGPSPLGSTSGRVAGEPVLSGVQIVGPTEVPLGESAQFKLIATMSDRSTRDVTNGAVWTSPNELASIAGPGRVQGRERGTATIEARFDGQQGRREVFVLPAGTFRLYGSLNELRSRGIPVIGARVEVTAGTGAGLSATTDPNGLFNLYGVAGSITLRVSQNGYPSKLHTLTVAEHQWITIELSPIGDRPDLAGPYTLTVAAASECGIGLGKGSLPEEMRLRTYKVTVESDGPWVYVSGQFGAAGQSFGGYVQPDSVRFFVHDPDDGVPIGERFSASRTVYIEGTAVVAIHPGPRLEGTLSGDLTLIESRALIASCSSMTHSFVLSR